MRHVCVAIITLLHWTLLLSACFIIILVAIFTCFMFLFMFDVHLSYHNKRLLTYLLTYLLKLTVLVNNETLFGLRYIDVYRPTVVRSYYTISCRDRWQCQLKPPGKGRLHFTLWPTAGTLVCSQP